MTTESHDFSPDDASPEAADAVVERTVGLWHVATVNRVTSLETPRTPSSIDVPPEQTVRENSDPKRMSPDRPGCPIAAQIPGTARGGDGLSFTLPRSQLSRPLALTQPAVGADRGAAHDLHSLGGDRFRLT